MGFFLFATASRPTVGPTQPAIQWIPGALTSWVKRPKREADHQYPYNSEVENAWSYISTPPILYVVMLIEAQDTSMAWYLVEHRDKFTLTLTLTLTFTFVPVL
jgi:hypothetical protein